MLVTVWMMKTVSETANSAALRLTKEISWMKEVFDVKSSFRLGPPSTYADRVFANEINFAIKDTEIIMMLPCFEML